MISNLNHVQPFMIPMIRHWKGQADRFKVTPNRGATKTSFKSALFRLPIWHEVSGKQPNNANGWLVGQVEQLTVDYGCGVLSLLMGQDNEWAWRVLELIELRK
eukprot:scaffold70873_cov71-Cyclotella_meneghiniana.AAC.7